MLPFANKRSFYLILMAILTVSIIIYLLPSTGADYEHYKYDYETAYSKTDFPYFFTNSILTAEPFYKFYSAFISVTTGLSFSGYLSLNFIITYFTMYIILQKFFLSRYIVVFLFIGLILIVPVLFYASPRSSVPFMFSTLAFLLYAEGKYFKAIFVSFLAISFHSQFIPILTILGISYMFYTYFFSKKKIPTYIYYIMILVLATILFVLSKYLTDILSFLIGFISFLPSGALIEGKIHYLDSSKSGFRITSLLSIIVFPIILFYIIKLNSFNKVFKPTLSPKYKERFIFLFSVLVVFSFIVNIIFINNAHVAGRISRLSDYLFMMIGIGTFLASFKNSNLVSMVVLIVILSIAPIIYSTMYNFELSILF